MRACSKQHSRTTLTKIPSFSCCIPKYCISFVSISIDESSAPAQSAPTIPKSLLPSPYDLHHYSQIGYCCQHRGPSTMKSKTNSAKKKSASFILSSPCASGPPPEFSGNLSTPPGSSQQRCDEGQSAGAPRTAANNSVDAGNISQNALRFP